MSIRGAAGNGRAGRTKSGVSLILVLGMLSLITVLAVALARSVRSERMSARGACDRARAGQLLHAALSRAMTEVNANMQGNTYPCWVTPADAMSSAGTNLCPDIFSGDATNIVPRALWADATNEATTCGWTNIIARDGGLQGRVAYLVVNASGLVDANTLAASNTLSQQLRSNLVDISGISDFREVLSLHGRYETISELKALNTIEPVSNLFVCSFPLNPDVYPTNAIGNGGVAFAQKFRINYFLETPEAITNYFTAATGVFSEAGYNAEYAWGLAWNLINELDTNRIPEGPSYAWREPIVEAVPLINEIVLRQIEGEPDPAYEIVVEMWYPFYRPGWGADTDEFTLQVGVFSNNVDVTVDESDVMAYTNQWSFTSLVSGMQYGTNTEFLCVTSPAANRIKFQGNVTNVPPVYYPLSESNSVRLLVRVLLNGQIVDEAMGGTYPADLRIKEYTRTSTNSVSNPLQNGLVSAWDEESEATLGGTNRNCVPFGPDGSGIPIVHRDGPMLRTGDLGYLPIPDMSNLWRNVDLMSPTGSCLAARMTARATNDTWRGLVSISTRQKEVLKALLWQPELGVPGRNFKMSYAEVSRLASVIAEMSRVYPFQDNEDFLYELGRAESEWFLDDGSIANGNLKEDAIRGILDWLTFRQNVFIIIAAAQVVPPSGFGVLAEQRCVAIVCRDAFTGACRIRSIRPIWQ